MLIDGSRGEGGGQILRTALAMAALLGRPVEITNIRANRKKPGLRPQHLAAVKALATISAAQTEGAQENSTRLCFTPQTLQGGRYKFVIPTAGSATLLFAAILPALLFSAEPSRVVIRGGTHVPFSPPYDYLESVFLPVLRRLGAEVRVELKNFGWYPAGGGEIFAEIQPCRGLRGLRLNERGPLEELEMSAVLANLPLHIAEREQDHVRKHLAKEGFKVNCRLVPGPSPGQGNMVFVRGKFSETIAGFGVLGRRGKPAEEVAGDACREWLAFARSQATADSHLADQLVLYMALAQGRSSMLTQELTSHLLTNVWVIRQFLPTQFEMAPETGRVEVEGVGFSVPR